MSAVLLIQALYSRLKYTYCQRFILNTLSYRQSARRVGNESCLQKQQMNTNHIMYMDLV